MLYMMIERYRNHNAAAVYKRFQERGRMMPSGLRYINSWVDTTFDRCFQLMETDDPALFDQWTVHCNDLADFEIVPVMTSAEAAVAAIHDERDERQAGR